MLGACDAVIVYRNNKKVYRVQGWRYTDIRSCIMDIEDVAGFTRHEAFLYIRALPVVHNNKSLYRVYAESL